MYARLLAAGGRRALTGVFAIGALALGSCGGASTSSTPVSEASPPAGVAGMSLSDTAKALVTPAQAETGVWSVVAHLDLAVYGTNGHELLHGSQPLADNTLYLYGFEIGLLAREVSNAPDTWDDFAARFAASDPSIAVTSPALESAVINFYASHPDDYSGQVLKAMNVDLSGSGSLSSFDEWLIIADVLIIHGNEATLAVAPARQAAATYVLLAAEAATPSVVQLIELSHGVVLAGVFVYSVDPSGPVDLKMGESGPGESAQFVMRAMFVPPQQGIFGVPSKGVLKNYDCIFSLPYGPVGNAPVRWGQRSLSQYGDFRPTAQSVEGLAAPLGNTDAGGAAPRLVYQTHQDPGHGYGQAEVGNGRVAFMVRPKTPASCTQNAELVRVEAANHAEIVAVRVHYHLPSYVVVIKVTVSCGKTSGTVSINGTLKASIDDPSALNGTATYAVAGKGANFSGTTKLIGQLIKSGTQLSIVTGPIGSFGGFATLGAIGPFVVPVEGGNTSATPPSCGTTANVTVTPLS